jgi:hypothetical protein
MECQKQKKLNACPCTYPGCARKGICCECIKYHRQRNELPACFFGKEAEASFDRSLEKFLEGKK